MSGPLTKIIASNVQAEMNRRGWSQQVMAEKTGIPQQTLSRRLRTEDPSPFDTNELERVARALGRTVDQLVCAPTGGAS
jgi:transcriptional regulator with XRE-family HTH domain